jgi:hypothetical protein
MYPEHEFILDVPIEQPDPDKAWKEVPKKAGH